VPGGLRGWVVKGEGGERGPFGADAVARSLAEGFIHGTTLVRAEDETEWHPASEVFHAEPRAPAAARRKRRPRAREEAAHQSEDDDERFLVRVGVDGEARGPVNADGIALVLSRSERRMAFVRAESAGDDDWTPYSRFLASRRGPEPPSREWLSDVTRAALARLAGAALMLAVGAGLSVVTSRIFVGLVIGGVLLGGRAVYLWGDGRA
jgi:hypothetical protein